jgi:hypothetical protein
MPLVDLGGEQRIAGHACTRREQIFAFEQAEGIFGGEGLVAGHPPASIQALSLARPRRIQLFIVPNGSSMRSASSA